MVGGKLFVIVQESRSCLFTTWTIEIETNISVSQDIETISERTQLEMTKVKEKPKQSSPFEQNKKTVWYAQKKCNQ